LDHDADGKVVWDYEPEKVQSVILLRKGEDSLPALHDVEIKIRELNEHPGRMLPGVKIDTYYDRTELINITTETVRENLLTGMLLVTVILFMFLSNVRSALIVAVNIPLALLFAFSVMYFRGKSANLLSIGAVDFGIIVDSSVIMVENIYRHLSAGEYPELPIKERIIKAAREIERPLFFSTLIMVCAFIPLFTMSGPEGQLFGPMAQTYAFALGGALLLALLVSPVLCLFLFKRLGPARDNALVRFLKAGYLRQLDRALNHRLLEIRLAERLAGPQPLVEGGARIFRRLHGVSPWESEDPSSSRVWWSDAGVHQNITFPVHPDPISGQHCWHQAVRVRRAGPDDRYGDIAVDTQKSAAVFREWLALTRSADRYSPDGTRRPYWLMRPLRPATDAYRLPAGAPPRDGEPAPAGR